MDAVAIYYAATFVALTGIMRSCFSESNPQFTYVLEVSSHFGVGSLKSTTPSANIKTFTIIVGIM